MPRLGPGKVCHLALPARDIDASAAFYEAVFGWRIHRGPGPTTFDDSVDEVSGHFDPRLEPAAAPGLVAYLMVDDLDAALERLRASGASVVDPPGIDPGELTAHFLDPAGNRLGIYQEP